MKVTIQVVIERDDEPPIVDEIACLERGALTPDTLGLTLSEAKTVLAQLQDVMVRQQAAAYVAQQQTCPHCSRERICCCKYARRYLTTTYGQRSNAGIQHWSK